MESLITIGIIVGILAGLVTIGGGLVVVCRFVMKRWPWKKKLAADHAVAEQTELLRQAVGIVAVGILGQMAEYLDGLSTTANRAIRDLFERGRAHQKKGEYREALALFQACLRQGASGRERLALNILMGNCHSAQGHVTDAEEHYNVALNEARLAQDKEGIAAALEGLALVYGQKGAVDRAFEHHQHALKIYEEIGDRRGQAKALGNLGNICVKRGELNKALVHHQRTLKIAREVRDTVLEASTLGDLGIIYQMKGALDRALAHHQRSLELDRATGYRLGEAKDLAVLGLFYTRKGQDDKALDYLKQALAIFEEIGATLEIQKTKHVIERVKAEMEAE